MPLALHNPPLPLPLLLLLALLAAAALLAGALPIYWWLRRRRDASSSTSLRLTDYETTEERDLHDQRRRGAV